jgi:hypothetical protein
MVEDEMGRHFIASLQLACVDPHRKLKEGKSFACRGPWFAADLEVPDGWLPIPPNMIAFRGRSN